MALDARVVLHGPEYPRKDLPRTAIRAVPDALRPPLEIREDDAQSPSAPIRPEDEP